jgi:pimeloyl-ACP methyl ester carboxylesterase
LEDQHLLSLVFPSLLYLIPQVLVSSTFIFLRLNCPNQFPTMSTKPKIVLTAGAWHTPAAFATLISKLKDAGYTVYTEKLPSVGNPTPPEDLSEDIAALQGLVTKAIGDGNDVVVVCHSWSGIVASSGLVGYSKKQREEAGKQGGVVKGAYMCAFLVPEGVSLMDALQHQVPDWWAPEVCSPLSPITAPYFYNYKFEPW